MVINQINHKLMRYKVVKVQNFFWITIKILLLKFIMLPVGLSSNKNIRFKTTAILGMFIISPPGLKSLRQH